MKHQRKLINEFLLALDGFVERYSNIIDINDLRDTFMPPFIMSIHERKKSITKGKTVTVPQLTRIINSVSFKRKGAFQTKRKTFYTMCIAYGAEYKYVEDISYEHIFYKMCLRSGLIVPFVDLHADYLSRYVGSMKQFILPEVYNHNHDLLIY